jgi:predicted NBD/HSP70 family sugar kinase
LSEVIEGRLGLDTQSSVDIFAEILKRGPLARVDIARRIGLSQAAVTKAVTPLIRNGLVSPGEQSPSLSAGRPTQPLKVNEAAQLSIGVTIRVDEIFGVVTTMRAKIVHTVYRPLASTSVHAVVEGVAELVATLEARLGEASSTVLGIGVALSGDVDRVNGIVRNSPRLNWREVDLGSLLAERLGRPVLLENDVHALTIAEELFGIGVDAESFAIVTIGAGIGCGLFVNGDVVDGAFGVAGEIGHLPLAHNEILCSCGNRGCVETVASSSAIANAVRHLTGDPLLSMREAVQLARAGNSGAIRAFEQAADLIGTALATIANLVGPEVIIVAGESVTEYDLYEQSLRESFGQHVFASAAACTIVTRAHTFEDWARGAAASVIRAAIRLVPMSP